MTENPVPQDEVPDDERMSPGDLGLVLRWLGLDQRALSQVLGVDERTVRRWAAGEYAIPDGVRLEIESMENDAAEAVGRVVEALKDARDPGVIIYRTSEQMWSERPDLRPYPTGWWTMVCARAVHEVPGVEIHYADE